MSSQTLPTASSISHAAPAPVPAPAPSLAPAQSSNCSSEFASDSLVADDAAAAADGTATEAVAATDMTEVEVEDYVGQNGKEPCRKSVTESINMPCGVCSTMVSPLLPHSIPFTVISLHEMNVPADYLKNMNSNINC